KGDIYCAGVPAPKKINVADRAYFKRAVETKSFTVGELIYSRTTGKPIFLWAMPVFDDKGTMNGMVLTSLEATKMRRLSEAAQLPEGSSFTVVARNGTVVIHDPDPDNKLIGQTKAEHPLVRALIKQGSGTVEAEGLDGRTRLNAFARIAGAAGGSD